MFNKPIQATKRFVKTWINRFKKSVNQSIKGVPFWTLVGLIAQTLAVIVLLVFVVTEGTKATNYVWSLATNLPWNKILWVSLGVAVIAFIIWGSIWISKNEKRKETVKKVTESKWLPRIFWATVIVTLVTFIVLPKISELEIERVREQRVIRDNQMKYALEHPIVSSVTDTILFATTNSWTAPIYFAPNVMVSCYGLRVGATYEMKTPNGVYRLSPDHVDHVPTIPSASFKALSDSVEKIWCKTSRM
jgi:hypothetical protein